MDFSNWTDYYRLNSNHFDFYRAPNQPELTEAEKTLITSSIQQFQRGEHSEGKNLFRYAFELQRDDYIEAIKLFIREEQTHARVLGEFMTSQGISKIRQHWVDDVFRKLRKLASLENSLLVLLTAEIISDTYYKALYRATNSPSLQSICTQIDRDEEMHINFQCYTLGLFYEKRSLVGKLFTRVFHGVLTLGTIGVVWLHHRPVLKAGGYSFFAWTKSVLREFARADLMITRKIGLAIRPLSASC